MLKDNVITYILLQSKNNVNIEIATKGWNIYNYRHVNQRQ